MHPLLLTLLTTITDIGDSAVLSAIVLLGVPYLALCGLRREAAFLALIYIATSGIMVVLKMLALVCHQKLPIAHMVSPSGHTALTICVLGMVGLIIARSVRRATRVVVALLTASMAIGVAITRYALGFHSLAEIVAGFIVGSLLLTTFGYALYRRPRSAATGRFAFQPAVLAAILLVTVITTTGTRLPAESLIDRMALSLNGAIRICE